MKEGETGIALAATVAGDGKTGGSELLEAGERAGEYELVRHLGSGAMGDVYEGRHPVIGKRVAIKVIKHVLASSEEAAERFIREARAVNQVAHPNVADVFAFGRMSDGRLYLAMDYLEGESLGDKLRRDGALSLNRFFAVMEEVCAAVAAAHDRGIIHRDLKPDNVFLTEDGKVYVLDFGVAKILHDAAANAGRATLTGEGVWIGTPAYMAPEQWTAEGASTASDVYSLGAMAYEMLTGRVPYQADSVPGIMQMHFNAVPPPLRTGGPKALPARIESAIACALAKDPGGRFESADAFWKGLTGDIRVPRSRGYANGLEEGGGPRWRPWAVGGLGVAVVLGGFLFWWSQGRAEPRPGLRGNEADLEKPGGTGAPEGPHTIVNTAPTGAMIVIDGKPAGHSPYTLRGDAGDVVPIVARKPGFLESQATVTVGKELPAIQLPPVRGFEGLWVTHDGKLRAFRRYQDKVAAYKLVRADGPQTFYRYFTFTPDDEGRIVFEATGTRVEDRFPNEPSCRWQVVGQYVYEPARDAMKARAQDVHYTVKNGKCVVSKIPWSEYHPVERVGDGTGSRVAHSDVLGGKTKSKQRTEKRPTPRRQKPRRVGKEPPQKLDPGKNANNAVDLKDPLQQQAAEPPSPKNRKAIKQPVQRRSKIPQQPNQRQPRLKK